MATSRPKITSKTSRRFGEVLGGGRRLPLTRLQTPPGFHGPLKAAKRSKLTDYAKQLLEKQKARYIYGIKEKQFRKYVEKAIHNPEISNVALHTILELRLDNAVYRLGFAPTRAAARQMVSHGLLKVNDKRMNVPSYQLKQGDVIQLREKIKKSPMFDHLVARLTRVTTPSWLTRDDKEITAKVVSMPVDADFDKSFDTTQIIEFYSR